MGHGMAMHVGIDGVGWEIGMGEGRRATLTSECKKRGRDA
jgi:hypothetical protein